VLVFLEKWLNGETESQHEASGHHPRNDSPIRPRRVHYSPRDSFSEYMRFVVSPFAHPFAYKRFDVLVEIFEFEEPEHAGYNKRGDYPKR